MPINHKPAASHSKSPGQITATIHHTHEHIGEVCEAGHMNFLFWYNKTGKPRDIQGSVAVLTSADIPTSLYHAWARLA